MRSVRDLTGRAGIVSVKGDTGTMISDISFDSRKVGPGTLFVAVRGTKSDGHDFIPAAVSSGASAVVCERLPENPTEGVCWILTDDSARALGVVASEFFGNPSSSLKLTGITGTNGKTTIATLLYRVFSGLGYKCGLFSTVCNYIVNKELPATHTTPDPVELNRTLAEMLKAGCDYVFMEVSSHAVDQKRIAGLQFAGGIFTNLTHDHLDYHKTFDNYLKAKKEFFDSLPGSAFALVNNDDKNGKVMVQNCRASKYSFSTKGLADFRCTVLEQDFSGMSLRIQGKNVWTRFIGDHNASNLLAVFSAASILGAEDEEVLRILSELRSVPGRLELVEGPGGISCLVDYAHTPDALRNVISAVNRIRPGDRQLITVVGAGGDRDRAKRPLMASITAEGSTKVILTSDNPRTEDPEKILDDMEVGITPDMRRKVLRITSRREAIKTAVMLAVPGDVVLVAGKGHENYQEINGVKHHFDDREELRAALLLKNNN
ncbi:MAG: UDP-N-acetylmuramoyl-L-alanyl-D-glutamate--2,6-diaminopimelate ligase [Bacteroidales bacterium]|jgi:UDP-N-acetylmuramoyl-L-alanyl-D-glutamate--2,6-diaminopimelate ligase|nr:UDP-N-acetylmuramoyl-L-alanyl-D-glutamate--2,6-diaminopimelate ligase [Bacteroidales bacterium]MBP7037328.1 UDP-N-acetylmuramoyl-L-alanyl-D-glutamate--2,6-diaminopimelate ligase [Bacteroidales bacterium]MDI9552451.1 UDP-N-acetylmuramoyl-L-alanyl-D-glutamate--2,6-diaminopimelate ligase [Bacteroidota bacterium]